MEALRRALPHTIISQGYGLTEASGLITSFNIMENEDLRLCMKNINSCGRVKLGIKWKVSIKHFFYLSGIDTRGWFKKHVGKWRTLLKI